MTPLIGFFRLSPDSKKVPSARLIDIQILIYTRAPLPSILCSRYIEIVNLVKSRYIAGFIHTLTLTWRQTEIGDRRGMFKTGPDNICGGLALSITPSGVLL